MGTALRQGSANLYAVNSRELSSNQEASMALLLGSSFLVVVLAIVGFVLVRVPDPHHEFSIELWGRLWSKSDPESDFEMKAAD